MLQVAYICGSFKVKQQVIRLSLITEQSVVKLNNLFKKSFLIWIKVQKISTAFQIYMKHNNIDVVLVIHMKIFGDNHGGMCHC